MSPADFNALESEYGHVLSEAQFMECYRRLNVNWPELRVDGRPGDYRYRLRIVVRVDDPDEGSRSWAVCYIERGPKKMLELLAKLWEVPPPKTGKRQYGGKRQYNDKRPERPHRYISVQEPDDTEVRHARSRTTPHRT